MKRLCVAVLSLLAFASVAFVCRAEYSRYPPAVVTVVTTRTTSYPYPALATFDIPIPAENLATTDSLYLVGEHTQFYACQSEPSPLKSASSTFDYIRITALVPCRNQALTLVPIEAAFRPEVLVVSSQLVGKSLTLETRAVQAKINPEHLRIAEQFLLFGHEIMPRYDDSLLNRQQSVQLILVDRSRRAEFALVPEVDPDGFSLERRGPVIATALYRGRFVGNPGIPPIPFEARFSLAAHSLMRFSVVIHPGAFDRAAFAVKGLHLTVPCILGTASTLDFGGLYENSLGKKHYYSGRVDFDLKMDGSYSCLDPMSMDLRGKGGISWVDYNDGVRGLAFFFDCAKTAFSLTADYGEDVLDVTIAPPDTTANDELSIETWFFFHPGRGGIDTLGHVSESLLTPPAVELSPEYVRAVTEFK